MLDAALSELLDKGWTGFTMAGAARRAGASKETLYAWFTSRDGLIRALIQRSADASAAAIQQALAGSEDVAETLRAYAEGLFTLLTGAQSIVLNRAAMSTPALADTLRAEGRHRVGPMVEAYLADRHATGDLDCPDPAAAFEVLYGLVVRDTQIDVLLGAQPPDAAAIKQRAADAVNLFLRLHARQPRSGDRST